MQLAGQTNYNMVFECKVVDDTDIYPVIEFQSLKDFAIVTQVDNRHDWLQPQILPVDDQAKIEITNRHNNPVVISRLEHFADVLPCEDVSSQKRENLNS